MNILIVDDSFLFREQLRDDLEDADFAVIEADGAASALRQVEAGARPDCVISDLNMPDMDGLAFAERLKGLLGETSPPIFVLSADRTELAREKARELGVMAWIVKPYDKGTLIKAIQRVVSYAHA